MIIKNLLLANKKTVASVIGVAGLLVTLYQLHDSIYDRGRESMRIELTKQYNKQLSEQREQYEKEIEKSISRIHQDYQDELERVRSEREIITKVETVTEYVNKEIIVQPDCDLLASDIISVLKQSTEIITNSTTKIN